MAIYHLTAKIVKRSEGRSVVAAAAYRSGDCLTNEWDGLTHDYTKKQWIEHTEIFLPENAPDRFKDRSTLWNEVEEIEKAGNSQLAREVEISLPNELTPEARKELIRNYIQVAFVEKGMCADLAIHNPPVRNDKKQPLDPNGNPTSNIDEMTFQNPHAHILLTMRPLDNEGKWETKYEKSYVCQKDNAVAVIPTRAIKEAEKDGWQKLYRYYMGRHKRWLTAARGSSQKLKRVDKNPKVKNTPNPTIASWNSRETLEEWRKIWEEQCNEALKKHGFTERIDRRSYEEQGINLVPSVHMGSDAYHMQKKGIETNLGELNRFIHADNCFLNRLKKEIETTIRIEKDKAKKALLNLQGLRARYIAAAYQDLLLSAETDEGRSIREAQIRTSKALVDTILQTEDVISNLSKLIAAKLSEFHKMSAFHFQIRAKLKQEIDILRKQREAKETELSDLRIQKDKLKISDTKSGQLYNDEVIKAKADRILELSEMKEDILKDFNAELAASQSLLERYRDDIEADSRKWDEQLELRFREQTDRFDKALFEKAKLRAPKIMETKTEGLCMEEEHKRKRA